MMNPAHPSFDQWYRTAALSPYLTAYRMASDHIHVMDA